MSNLLPALRIPNISKNGSYVLFLMSTVNVIIEEILLFINLRVDRLRIENGQNIINYFRICTPQIPCNQVNHDNQWLDQQKHGI